MSVSIVRLASAPRSALAMCLCAALTAAASSAPSSATTPHSSGSLIPVTSCADDGSAGTLRKAIEGAVDGDTIDMSDLQCSLITLQGGALVSAVPNLAIQGPGIDALTIDGGNAGRVLEGMALDISDLTISHGVSLSYTGGGCVRADGDVSLTRVRVTACLNVSSTVAAGGAVFALGTLTMNESMLVGNKASGLTFAEGGGAFVIGAAMLYGSVISGNSAEAGQDDAFGGGMMTISGDVTLSSSKMTDNTATSMNGRAYGGGLHSQGGATSSIRDGSTVSGNVAHSGTNWAYGGGINGGHYNYAVPTSIDIERSTISGNTVESDCAGSCFVSGGGVHGFDSVGAKYSTIDNNDARCTDAMSFCTATGGGLSSSGSVTSVSIGLLNSTISANSAVGGGALGAIGFGGGFWIGSDKNFTADSSTIAFNHASTNGGGIAATSPASAPSHLTSTAVASNDTDSNGDNDIASTLPGFILSIDGSKNLVMNAAGGVVLPVGTLTADPQLLPLTTDEGGATAIHPLPANSVAVDAGSNPDLLGCDQRSFPYRRVQGAAADIGAYEYQGEKHLFADGFEVPGASCPPAMP